MTNAYYKIPLLLKKVMESEELPTCNLTESIAQNIYLIITSSFGEFRSDASYGSYVWDSDFELIGNKNTWCDNINKSISMSLKKHERRLNDIRVDVGITQTDISDKTNKVSRIKYKLIVDIKGQVALTNEPFKFHLDLYLSPISID